MKSKNSKSINAINDYQVQDSDMAHAGKPSSGTARLKGNSQKSMLEHWFLFVEDENEGKEKNRITLKPKEKREIDND